MFCSRPLGLEKYMGGKQENRSGPFGERVEQEWSKVGVKRLWLFYNGLIL